MGQISRAQKFGAFLAAANKTLARPRYSQSRRVGYAVAAGAKAAFGSVARVLRLLWLQTTGLFFLFFAFGFGAAAVRQYRIWSTDHANGGKLALITSFSLLFAWFGITSFWRARRASKQS